MKKKFVIANWKMNGTREYAEKFVSRIAELKEKIDFENQCVIICPPVTLIDIFADAVNKKNDKCDYIEIGGQNCHHKNDFGSYTGDISGKMLKDSGCSYVIVGHSERRKQHEEGNELVRKKALIAYQAGLTPIICIGEDDNYSDPWEYLEKQCMESIAECNAIIAYEPVWAIGSGRVPSMDHIERVTENIRNYASLPVLYGGSVNQDNVAEISRITDGVLVGKASLDFDSLTSIIMAQKLYIKNISK